MLEWEGNLPFFMERDKLKLIVRNLKLLVEALESEVYSDVDAYKTKQENFDDPAAYYMTDYDETQAIGRRYRRQDEIGTPLCVTVDFDSLDDNAVTVRDRDSMEQTRVPIDQLLGELSGRLGF